MQQGDERHSLLITVQTALRGTACAERLPYLIRVESGSLSVTQLTKKSSESRDEISGSSVVLSDDRCFQDRIKVGDGVGATCTIAGSRGH